MKDGDRKVLAGWSLDAVFLFQERSSDYGNLNDSRSEAQVRTFNGATESGREGQLA